MQQTLANGEAGAEEGPPALLSRVQQRSCMLDRGIPFVCVQMPCLVAAGAGRHEEAVQGYELGGDAAAAVQVLLGALGDPGRAAVLARRSGDRGAAEAVAQHCSAAADHQVWYGKAGWTKGKCSIYSRSTGALATGGRPRRLWSTAARPRTTRLGLRVYSIRV